MTRPFDRVHVIGAGESPAAPSAPAAGAQYLERWPLGPPTDDVMPHPSGRGWCRRRVVFGDTHGARRRSGAHQAQDIFAPRGTAVFAPIGGFVATSTWGPNGGWQVTIRGPRAQVLLSHLAYRPLVQEGDIIEPGEQVGVVGNTGNASNTCPHLHLQLRRMPGRVVVNAHPDLLALAPATDVQWSRGRSTDPSASSSSSSSAGWFFAGGAALGLAALAFARKGGRRGGR